MFVNVCSYGDFSASLALVCVSVCVCVFCRADQDTLKIQSFLNCNGKQCPNQYFKEESQARTSLYNFNCSTLCSSYDTHNYTNDSVG